MEIQQKIEQRQQQRLIMTPQLRQAMHILQLPILELKNLLQEELIKNPLLQEQTDETEEEKDETKEETTELDSKWEEYFQAVRPPRKYTKEDREKRDYLESSITKPISLQHYLSQQLEETNLKGSNKEIAEIIIANIDDDGYFKADLAEIAHLLKVTEDKVAKILSIIQEFDPPGVGARDLKECLQMQLKDKKVEDSLIEEIISKYLDELASKKYHKIITSLKISEKDLKEKIRIISQFEPKPGREYSSTQINFIIPDVIVKKIDGEYKIIINERELPLLRINPLYKKILKEKSKTDKTAKYIKEKLSSAEWLIKNIQQRQDTIYKVASYIVGKQKAFLDKGAGHLKVLTLKDVAEATNLHTSTISRVTSTKYIETPRGIFKLRYFFSGGLPKSKGTFQKGEITSSKNVKNVIKTLIEEESTSKPLSDQKITDILNKKGYEIARRTVAKYREQLGILPSKMRRSL